MANGKRVKNWMRAVKQPVPASVTFVNTDTAKLRNILIQEEASEVQEEMQHYINELRNGVTKPDRLAKVAKELSDQLIVAYGALVAFGFDPDVIFNMVMDNNDKKVAVGYFNGDGKLITDPDTKAQLKQEIHDQLVAYVNQHS